MAKSQDQSLYLLLHMLPIFRGSTLPQLNAQHILSDRLPSPPPTKDLCSRSESGCLMLTLISLLYVSQQRQKQTFAFLILPNNTDVKEPRNKGNRLSSVSNLIGANRQRADEQTDKHTGKQWTRAVKWIPGVGCTWISLSAYPVKSPWNGKADEQGPKIEVREGRVSVP